MTPGKTLVRRNKIVSNVFYKKIPKHVEFREMGGGERREFLQISQKVPFASCFLSCILNVTDPDWTLFFR